VRCEMQRVGLEVWHRCAKCGKPQPDENLTRVPTAIAGAPGARYCPECYGEVREDIAAWKETTVQALRGSDVRYEQG
jgi:NAD-dependent SIR2 family protein deacetylase